MTYPLRYSKTSWTKSSATCSSWLCLEEGVGLNNLQTSLPTSTALWIYLPPSYSEQAKSFSNPSKTSVQSPSPALSACNTNSEMTWPSDHSLTSLTPRLSLGQHWIPICLPVMLCITCPCVQVTAQNTHVVFFVFLIYLNRFIKISLYIWLLSLQ